MKRLLIIFFSITPALLAEKKEPNFFHKTLHALQIAKNICFLPWIKKEAQRQAKMSSDQVQAWNDCQARSGLGTINKLKYFLLAKEIEIKDCANLAPGQLPIKILINLYLEMKKRKLSLLKIIHFSQRFSKKLGLGSPKIIVHINYPLIYAVINLINKEFSALTERQKFIVGQSIAKDVEEFFNQNHNKLGKQDKIEGLKVHLDPALTKHELDTSLMANIEFAKMFCDVKLLIKKINPELAQKLDQLKPVKTPTQKQDNLSTVKGSSSQPKDS